LRILHMPSVFPDPDFDQPHLMIFVAEHVRAAGIHHDNIVLYKSPNPPTNGHALQVSRTIDQGIRVIRIHTRRGSGLANRAQTYWGVGAEILRLLASGFHPDVIHAHIFSEARMAMGLARMLHVPLVTTEHWTALCREGALSRERLNFAKQVYEQSAMVLPVCDYLRRCIETNTGARFKNRIIFNAVDATIFFDDGRKRKKQILTVARLEPAKDIPTLLRAFALLKNKNISLKIVGRGDALPFIVLSKELGIFEQVEFLGEQTKLAIAELMRESAVFALSSLWENSPCVIGEALCCGLPVVATRVGGVPELLTQAEGRLVPHSQPESMTRALAEILECPQQFTSHDIAEKARARFNYEAIGAQLDEVYCEVAHV
jgi:glycosyltransferase involved in cell wall biosynthesis